MNISVSVLRIFSLHQVLLILNNEYNNTFRKSLNEIHADAEKKANDNDNEKRSTSNRKENISAEQLNAKFYEQLWNDDQLYSKYSQFSVHYSPFKVLFFNLFVVECVI